MASFTETHTSAVNVGRELYPMNISVLPELDRFSSSSLLIDTHISNTSCEQILPFGVTDLGIFRVDVDDGNLLVDELETVGTHVAYSNVLFAWGYISPSSNRTIKAVAMGCNETLEVVFVNTAFTGSGTANQSKSIIFPGMLSSYYSSAWDYESKSSSPFTNQSLFDDYMALLVAQSGSTLSIDDFADEDKSGAIIEAIKDLYGILAAQRLDYEFRVDCDRVHAFEALGNITSLPGASIGNGYRPQSGPQTIVAGGELRLVQSTTLSRILQGILGAMLGLSLIAWAARPRTNILPRDGMSIGTIGALIAGGDLGSYLASVGPNGSRQKIIEKDTKFWLGWRTGRGKWGLEKRFGIWVIQEEWEMNARAGLT